MATWVKQAAALPGWILADRPEDLSSAPGRTTGVNAAGDLFTYGLHPPTLRRFYGARRRT